MLGDGAGVRWRVRWGCCIFLGGGRIAWLEWSVVYGVFWWFDLEQMGRMVDRILLSVQYYSIRGIDRSLASRKPSRMT